MAYSEFYCQTTGSNLNAGSTTADAASLTYAGGTFVRSTRTFTVASGDPVADGVIAGDFVSIYTTAGATVATYVGRVESRTTTEIVVHATAIAGTTTTVSESAAAATCKVGGAWAGPNAAVDFPFDFADNPLVNTSGDRIRVNIKSGTTYNITAGISANKIGVTFQGYTTTVGDGGRAIIDGGTSNITLLTISGAGVVVDSLIFQNNATGQGHGIYIGAADIIVRRCVVHGVRGCGIYVAGDCIVDECEVYDCNKSNTANYGGFVCFSGIPYFRNCISHDNAGTNSSGFVFSSSSSVSCVNCIADTNGQHGFFTPTARSYYTLINSDAYNNVGDGFRLIVSIQPTIGYAINCNFVKNGAYGFQISGSPTTSYIRAINCGFGAGTQANSSGTYLADTYHVSDDEVVYAADVTPWVDPDNGDFRITLAAAKNAGRGAFVQTQAGYAGTIGYPDIGAAQHLAAGGGGTIFNVIGSA